MLMSANALFELIHSRYLLPTFTCYMYTFLNISNGNLATILLFPGLAL